jgi:hypothetical protein
MRDGLATDGLRATDVMAVLGAHPYKRSSGSPGVYPTASVQSSSDRADLRLAKPGAGHSGVVT